MRGDKIAGFALEKNAAKLRPSDPFQWASGYRMPIYLDNRVLMSYPEVRQLVAEDLKTIIADHGINVDLIGGIPTGGITPAATLAQLLGKSIVVRDGENFYEIGPLSDVDFQASDVIASTCPMAMVGAVLLANDLGKQYLFVRQRKKDHGMQQKIEGVLAEGQTVYMIDQHLGDSYCDNAVKAIEEAGGQVMGSYSQELSLKPVSIKGKIVLPIEDHISLGGSSVDEVEMYRRAGATINDLLSISNYSFPEAVKTFEKAGITARSVYVYNNIINAAKKTGKFSDEQLIMLGEWSSDPFNWGAKYGFPRVTK